MATTTRVEVSTKETFVSGWDPQRSYPSEQLCYRNENLAFVKKTANIVDPQETWFSAHHHDCSIYFATFGKERVLLLRQVYDFSLACAHKQLAKHVYSHIGAALHFFRLHNNGSTRSRTFE